jgi:hypothetical protein
MSYVVHYSFCNLNEFIVILLILWLTESISRSADSIVSAVHVRTIFANIR